MHFPDTEQNGDADMTIVDERETLINEICNYLIPLVPDVREVKNELYMLMSEYEITNRCTEVAELETDRNDYLLKKFLIAKTVEGCSKRTIEFYGKSDKAVLQTIGKTVDNITADDIRYYMALRRQRDKVSKVTVGNEIRCLSSFFSWLHAEEIIQKNPMLRVDKIKGDKVKKEALTDLEIEKLRAMARGIREKMIIELLLSTGCRVSELCQILISEIDGSKILIHGKGAKDRYVYLNAKAELMLEMYLEKRKDRNPYLLPRMVPAITKKKKGISLKIACDWWMDPENIDEGHTDKGSIEYITRKIAKRAGVEQANPHKFRRTCATMALRRGMPIEQVSKMLGHEAISTTQIYLDLTEDELAQAHKKYVV